ncbi:unnamed protein product [Mytilus edulis]|uniref:B box-type domain-containing protein n=1 Tax=Mytilus edulis TaxID=6550 RepID=A0A8S3SDY3_MYTED|nr:unnamed protein product [Mytilus edulis]
MTFSQSIRRSQFPINCQLCEVDPNIQWKCQDCNLLMCQTCNDKIHPKFKNACKHRICDVKEVGIINEEQEIIIDFSNIPCQIHQGQDCCVFCKACNYLICATCVSTTHNGHTMGEIKEFYEIKMNTVRKVKADVKFKQRRLKEDELSLARINKYKSESYIHAKKDIISQTTTLTDAVVLYSDKLLSDLDRDHQYITKAYDEDKETIQNMKLRINKNINEIEDISRTTDAAKFFKQFENLTLMEKDLPLLAFPDDTVMEFDSGKITQSNFGSLHKMKKIPKCEIMLEASKEFQTEEISIENFETTTIYLLKSSKFSDM